MPAGSEAKRWCAEIAVLTFDLGGLELSCFGADPIEQAFPRRDKGIGTFALKIGGELFVVDAGFAKFGNHRFGVAAIGGRIPPGVPCSANASSVFSGMVSMVSGAANACT